MNKLLCLSMTSLFILSLTNAGMATDKTLQGWDKDLTDKNSIGISSKGMKGSPSKKFSSTKKQKLETPAEIPHDDLTSIFSAQLSIHNIAKKVWILNNTLLASHKEVYMTIKRVMEQLDKNPNIIAVLDEDESRAINTMGEDFDSVLGRYRLFDSTTEESIKNDEGKAYGLLNIVFSKEKE